MTDVDEEVDPAVALPLAREIISALRFRVRAIEEAWTITDKLLADAQAKIAELEAKLEATGSTEQQG